MEVVIKEVEEIKLNESDTGYDSDSSVTSIESQSSMEMETVEAMRSMANDLVYYCPFVQCQNASPFVHAQVFLDHLRSCHCLVIWEAANMIPVLQDYVNELHKLGKIGDVKQVTVYGGSGDDLELRRRFQHDKLQKVVEAQEKERHEDHRTESECLFCKEISPNRYDLFTHMFQVHRFNIGLLDNLVYVSEFLNVLQSKLDNRQCLYCEKFFKSKAVLRKHMRKKKHFRIHPRQHLYDKYYLINYAEPGKNWKNEEFCDLETSFVSDKSQDEWEDWNELVDDTTTCLFCEHIEKTAELILDHMKYTHEFDLTRIIRENDFYSVIKIINFIRRQTMEHKCMNCQTSFDSLDEMCVHMKSSGHFVLPDNSEWNLPQYFFPTHEDDPLLRIAEEV